MWCCLEDNQNKLSVKDVRVALRTSHGVTKRGIRRYMDVFLMHSDKNKDQAETGSGSANLLKEEFPWRIEL